MPLVLEFAATLTLVAYLLNQLRKPSKWLGRLILKDMSRRHAALTDWALNQMAIGDQQAILDVGLAVDELSRRWPRVHRTRRSSASITPRAASRSRDSTIEP